ncbi:MAG: nitroreductase family protein [Promethearchaeota archaeon]
MEPSELIMKDPAKILMKIIKERRSIRQFTNEDISDEMIENFLEAARWAPSAADVQDWEFIVVREKNIKEQLSNAASRQPSVRNAPVVIAVCANQIRSYSIFKSRGTDLYCYQDTAAAIQNLLLTVHAYNYGAVWVGAFDEKKVAEILKTPEKIRPIALIPIGRPVKLPRATPRYKLKKVTHLNQYGNKTFFK